MVLPAQMRRVLWPTLLPALLLLLVCVCSAKEGAFDANFGDMGTLVLALSGEPRQARGAVVHAPLGAQQLVVLGTSNATGGSRTTAQ